MRVAGAKLHQLPNRYPGAGPVDPRITRSTGHSSWIPLAARPARSSIASSATRVPAARIDERVVDIGGGMRSALRKGKTSSWAIIDTSTPSVRPARIARKALGTTRATELR